LSKDIKLLSKSLKDFMNTTWDSFTYCHKSKLTYFPRWSIRRLGFN